MSLEWKSSGRLMFFSLQTWLISNYNVFWTVFKILNSVSEPIEKK